MEIENLSRDYFIGNDDWLNTHIVKHPVWIAEVGEYGSDEYIEIIDDEGRPGIKTSSWTRLKALVEEHELELKRLFVKWRRKKQLAGENKACFFFARKIEFLSTIGGTRHSFLTGWADGDIINMTHWKAPTMSIGGTERREIWKSKPEFLIWNQSINQNTPTEKLGPTNT